MVSRVAIRRIGKASGTNVRLPATLAQLLAIASTKFQVPMVAVVDHSGDTIDDITLIRDGDVLYTAAEGEVWRAPVVTETYVAKRQAVTKANDKEAKRQAVHALHAGRRGGLPQPTPSTRHEGVAIVTKVHGHGPVLISLRQSLCLFTAACESPFDPNPG